MGIYCQVYAVPVSDIPRWFASRAAEQPDSARTVSLEKAWHGLHFLLTGLVGGGTAPLNFLFEGGAPVGNPDEWGYGPPRLFTPTEVVALHTVLAGINDDQLWSRYDAARMTEDGVYPMIWDEPEEELREEYLGYFGALKALVADVAANGLALVVVVA
jgi:hypothetical protein